jgi:PAS domain S-box-containing protein
MPRQEVSVDTTTLAPGPVAPHHRLGFGRGRRVRELLDPDAALTAPAKPPRLLLRFGVYAGIAMLVAAAAGTWVAGRNARVRAERDVWADARFTADQLGRDDLAKLALKGPVGSNVQADLDVLFGRAALDRGVVRVTLFARSGIVTYSTDHSLIGKMPYDLTQVRQALQGDEVHGTSRLRGGIGDNPIVLHSYAPVYWYFDKNSSPNGVIGIYREYAPVAQAIREETIVRAGTIIGALLILYLALFPILRGVTRTLQTRNKQLVKQADALRESEEQYRLIVETASEGVALLDAEGKIVFANQKLANLIGRPVDNLPGTSLVGLMDEHSRATADPRWFRRHHEQREFAFQLPAGGLAYTVISANPILDRDGSYSGALAMITDITERKRAEEAVHEMEPRLAQSPARKDTMQAAEIARDFDRTLTAISGYSDYLLNRLGPDDPLYREVTQLRSSARGIVPLTRQLLAISRRESLRSDYIDLAAVMAEVGEQLPRLVGDAVRIEVVADRSVAPIEADLAQIEQVLVNLALYVNESMPDGGRIVIETRDVDLDESFTRDHVPMRPGPYVLLSVSDDGAGLDEDARSGLFSPHFPGKGDDSAGLGLATVYGIVKQSQGFIWVDGAPGRGTRFRIYFPRSPEPSAA